MPKYLYTAHYTPEGVKGLVRDGGSGRRAAVEKAVAGAGGKLEAMYFAFGGHDAYLICELPSNATAAALALAVNASGLAATSTVVLLTAAEVDEATKKSIEYKPPGSK
jgi:uncharacterized protein with GYD domain